MEIKIKYHADIDRIQRIEVGDFIDLRSAEDVFIPKGAAYLISLGVSMKLPKGYEAIVVPRSSTFNKYGIIMTNSMGVIDNSYSGTNDVWHFPAYCLVGKGSEMGVTGTRIHKNERICQFRIQKSMEAVRFTEVDELDETDRGGFGSTGVK